MSPSFKNRLNQGCGGIWLSDKEPSAHQINNGHLVMLNRRWIVSKQWFSGPYAKYFFWKENYSSWNMKLNKTILGFLFWGKKKKTLSKITMRAGRKNGPRKQSERPQINLTCRICNRWKLRLRSLLKVESNWKKSH